MRVVHLGVIVCFEGYPVLATFDNIMVSNVFSPMQSMLPDLV
jgi:hypothetical protein